MLENHLSIYLSLLQISSLPRHSLSTIKIISLSYLVRLGDRLPPNSLKPPLEHLRRFGCDAYVYVPAQRRKKLDSRTRHCSHPGYVHNTTKLWRVWEIATGQVIQVPDVIFDERSSGGRARAHSLHPLSTLLIDELEDTIASDKLRDASPIDIGKDKSREESEKDDSSVLQVDDISSGSFLLIKDNRLGDSDEPISGTQPDDSPMPMGMSTVMSITQNGMALGKREHATSYSMAPDGHKL